MAAEGMKPAKPEGYYKVLLPDGRGPFYKHFRYDLPRENGDGSWTPGAWAEPAPLLPEFEGTADEHYARWLHITDNPEGYSYTGGVAYRIEVEGGEDAVRRTSYGGIVCKRLRLLHPITSAECERIQTAWRAWEKAKAETAPKTRAP